MSLIFANWMAQSTLIAFRSYCSDVVLVHAGSRLERRSLLRSAPPLRSAFSMVPLGGRHWRLDYIACSRLVPDEVAPPVNSPVMEGDRVFWLATLASQAPVG